MYETPRFRVGGDRYIEVEFGDEMSFDLNVSVHAVVAALREAQINGLVEIIPELASMQVSYDPDRISFDDMTREITATFEGMEDLHDQNLPSRIYYVPTLYFDPWTEECIADYREKVGDKTEDAEFICEENGLANRLELKRVHSGTEYWVAALGFWPGLCSLMPLDPRKGLIAPKYNPPRTWTPQGAIGIGGGLTCIYPDPTPGGYQIFARTPMPIWDRTQTLPAFKDSLALFKPGDRVRFVTIDRDEYDDIAREVGAGTYQHPHVDYQVFSVGAYRQWRKSLLEEST